MSTHSIQIQKNLNPTPAQPAVFSPRAVVANAGDTLTWHNADDQDHWPAPSASDKTGWIQFQIPSGSESRGDVALASNLFNVTAATAASPVVLTLDKPAPPTGTQVLIAYTPPPAPAPASPWAKVKGPFEVTNMGGNRCSIVFEGSGLGPFSTPASGKIAVAVPYTLNYVCALHPAETGTITVNPQL